MTGTASVGPIAILGGGRFARAVASTLARHNHTLRLWTRRFEVAEAMARDLAPQAQAARSVQGAVDGACATVVAVPICGMREVANRLGDVVQGDHVVLHAVRGVEPGFALPHAIIRQESCVQRIGVLGGPIYAPELAAGKTIAAVLATRFSEPMALAEGLIAGTPLRLHRSDDLVGVEVAGAIGNVATLAVGMAGELKLGATSRGLILTRALTEAASLAVSCGGQASTLVGLAGVGDMVPRQVGTTSRHLQAGAMLARGMSMAAAAQEVGGHLDGLGTAAAAAQLAAQRGLLLPLVEAVAQVAAGERSAAVALPEVLHLDLDPSEALLPA